MAELDSAENIPSPSNVEPATPARGQNEIDLLQISARLLLASLALGLAFYFASKGVSLARHYSDIVQDSYRAAGPPKFPAAGDITVFYTAGRVVVSGESSGLYDPDYFVPEVFRTQGWRDGDPFAGNGDWSKFYNPPFFALLLSPLTLLDVHSAYIVVFALNGAAALLLVYLLGRILSWRQPATVLLAMALFSYTPLYFVFQHSQPSLLLAVMLAASFLYMQAGSFKKSALLLALGGVKPQWLALPALILAIRERRAIIWSLISMTAIIAVPFLLVGFRGIGDYVDIVLARGSGDITNQDFSSAILSWSGFLRALTGSPQPELWALVSLVTVAAFVFVCLNGDVHLSAAAAIITTLLVVPHSHPQDWVVVVVAGAIALSRRAPMLSNLGTGLCLLAVYFAANDWPNASYKVSIGQHAAYWITPAGCALLFWFALQPLVETRILTARAPSIWRLEWESPALAGIRPWHMAGVAFSIGMVLGVGAALALVQGVTTAPRSAVGVLPPVTPETEAAQVLPFPVVAPASGLAYKGSSELATATSSWSLPAPNTRTQAQISGVGAQDASARAVGQDIQVQPQPSSSQPGSLSSGDGELAQVDPVSDSAIATARGEESDDGISAASASDSQSGDALLAVSQGSRAALISMSGGNAVKATAATFATTLNAVNRLSAANELGLQALGHFSNQVASAGWILESEVAAIRRSDPGFAQARSPRDYSDLPGHVFSSASAVVEVASQTIVEGLQTTKASSLLRKSDNVKDVTRSGARLLKDVASGLSASGTGAFSEAGRNKLMAGILDTTSTLRSLLAGSQALTKALATRASDQVSILGAMQASVAGRPLSASESEASFSGIWRDLASRLSSLGSSSYSLALLSSRPPVSEPEPVTSAPPPVVDRQDCEEIRATGAQSAGEEEFLRNACTPPTAEAVSEAPPPAPEPEPAAPAPPVVIPTARPPAPPPARCTRVVVTRQPSLVALAEGGFRFDAELAPTDPSGCGEWPAAFSASARLSITSGSRQGTWSCESNRNPTAGVSASTHFAFFCTIGQKSGPPGGDSSLVIQVTAFSEQGDALGSSNQAFPAPDIP